MQNAVSVFILDVTDSSKFNNGLELSEYLTKWQNVLANTNSTRKIAVKHRMGDEIICLVEGYSSALMIANYIIYNWKYQDNMPYFGVSCGMIEENINHINIETWNNILIKNARMANDKIKENKNRKKLIEFSPLNNNEIGEIELINILLQFQSAVILEQTAKQREILGLFSLMRSQKIIAARVGKSTSTISGHYTAGKTDLILEAAETLYNLLTLKETQSRIDSNNKNTVQEKLEEELKRNIKLFRFGQEY
ncbi:hypothetical protein CSE16_09815 [Solibacillus sp. R5-41]|uniref:hypothetical protein n=1 Tax=Solibacillus sp. R5-41 TaxID=2048654 RepID=UPI000C12871D|nr:hypothetical protein [Solibacillus sp. R5-41]ATP40318.1 hypothetical protein CSE16_09815 [Solibacillus sp. R5-41]